MPLSRLQAGLVVSIAPFLFGGWAMATPLSELSGQPEPGQVGAAPSSATPGAAYRDGTTESFARSFGDDGIVTTELSLSPPSQGMAQDWLRVRSHVGTVGAWSAFDGVESAMEFEPEEARPMEPVRNDGISVEELARLVLERDVAMGRRAAGGDSAAAAGAGAGQDEGVDLGLDLVRTILDHKMDRELALAALAHTIEIREFLLQLTESDQIADYQVVRAGNGRSAGAQAAGRDEAAERAITSPELDRLEHSGENSAVKSLKGFVVEFLTDIRIILFLGGSLALILLLSAVVTRWSRA